MVLDTIQDETEDRITYLAKKKLEDYISMLLGIGGTGYMIYWIWKSGDTFWYSGGFLTLIIWGGLGLTFTFKGINGVIFSKAVTIEKKSQNIIIKKDLKEGFLKSIKEIPFANIELIELKTLRYETGDYTYRINIKMLHRNPLIKIVCGSIEIYSTDDKSDAEMLLEKIRKITEYSINVKTDY